MFFADIFGIAAYVMCSLCASFTRVFVFLTQHGLQKSKMIHLGSIQLKIQASAPNDKLSSSSIPSVDMVPVVFKTADGSATVLMASNSSMADIQRRFAEVICRTSRISQAAKGNRVSKADTAAAAAEIASEIVITCDGRVLREGTLADACWSAGATIGVSLPQAGGMFSCLPFCIRRADGDEAEDRAVREAASSAGETTVVQGISEPETRGSEIPKAEVPKPDVPKAEIPKAEIPKPEVPKAGGVRSGRSIDRAGIDAIVRDVAQRAARSSEAWRTKTKGGTTVTSHSLRSAFMNRVDPDNNKSAENPEIFPGEAPFHPYDRYPLCPRDAGSRSTCCRDPSAADLLCPS
jgi:hypothetical protein